MTLLAHFTLHFWSNILWNYKPLWSCVSWGQPRIDRIVNTLLTSHKLVNHHNSPSTRNANAHFEGYVNVLPHMQPCQALLRRPQATMAASGRWLPSQLVWHCFSFLGRTLRTIKVPNVDSKVKSRWNFVYEWLSLLVIIVKQWYSMLDAKIYSFPCLQMLWLEVLPRSSCCGNGPKLALKFHMSPLCRLATFWWSWSPWVRHVTKVILMLKDAVLSRFWPQVVPCENSKYSNRN